MNHELSIRICQKLIDKGIIKEELKRVYTYGIELLLSFFISVSLILIVGTLTHRFVETLIFLFLFVSIRQMTGGYHAKTYFRCQIVTVGTFLLILLASYHLHPNITLHIILLVSGGVFILLFGPIENKHKPLSPAIKAKNKKLGAASFVLASGLSMILIYWKPRYADTAFFTLLSIILLMIVPLIERRIHHV